jgi:hypothetical protein
MSSTTRQIPLRVIPSVSTATCDFMEPLDDEDHIIFVKPFDSVYAGDCSAIEKEIWSTPTHPSPTVETPVCSCGSNQCNSSHKNVSVGHMVKDINTLEVRKLLKAWISCFKTPYTTFSEKKNIAEILGITYLQVTNFCNNHRKRYSKVGNTLKSYTQTCATI